MYESVASIQAESGLRDAECEASVVDTQVFLPEF